MVEESSNQSESVIGVRLVDDGDDLKGRMPLSSYHNNGFLSSLSKLFMEGIIMDGLDAILFIRFVLDIREVGSFFFFL